MSCTRDDGDLGAYVLGALEPAERAGVEAHLAGCAACRTEVAHLEALPPLLARLDLDEVTGPPVRPPADLFDRVRAAVDADVRPLRRRPGRRLLLAAAALLLAGAAAAVGVTVWPGGTDDPPTAAAAPTHVATAGDTRVSVVATAGSRGTELDVTVAGLAGGTRCQLFVVDSGDDWHATGDWAATPDGSAWFHAWTPVARDDLSQVVLLDGGGAELVRVPL